MTWWRVFPATVAALTLHALVGGAWWIDAVLVGVALVGKERVRVDARAIVTAATVGVALVGLRAGARTVPGVASAGFGGGLASIGGGLAGGAALVLALRALLRAPPGGRRLDLALGTLVVLGCSAIDGGPRFVVGLVAFAVAALVALHGAAVGGTPWRALDRRTRRLVVAHVVIAASVACASAAALVPIHHFFWRQILERGGWFTERSTASSFAPDITLTSDTDLALSDQPVLEVTGAPVDHLRGAVLSAYSQGHWSPARDELRELAVDSTRGALATEVRAEAPQVRLFAPLGVARLATPAGRARVDDAGIVFAEPGERSVRVWFTAADRCVDCAGPTPQDTALPRGAEEDWRRLAQRWLPNAATVDEKIDAISRRFAREFRYSLQSHRTRGVDPIWDFLTATPVGHCEYFASGMVLLLRAAGVPARVVTGYRVAEYDALNERYVVRQKHAHAWVEAWDPATGWRTADPTPPTALAEIFPAHTPLASRAWRWLQRHVSVSRVARLRVAVGVGVAIAALGCFAAIRALRRRSPRRRGSDADPPSRGALHALLASAQSVGVDRPAHETLESFAARVRDGALLGEASARVAESLEGYAALRYGGAGDAASIEASLRGAARTIASLKTPTTPSSS